MPSVEDRATLCVQGRWGHPWLLGEGPPSLRRVLPQCEPPAPDPPTTGPGGPSTLGPEASWTGWLLLLTDPVLLWGQCAVCARALTPGTTTQMHFLAPPEVSDTQGGGNTHLSAWEDLAPPCGRARPACREGSVAQHPHNPAPCPLPPAPCPDPCPPPRPLPPCPPPLPPARLCCRSPVPEAPPVVPGPRAQARWPSRRLHGQGVVGASRAGLPAGDPPSPSLLPLLRPFWASVPPQPLCFPPS